MPLCPTNNERRVEIPWLLSRLGTPRRLLDVGHADADYAPELIAAGTEEVALQDVRHFRPRHVERLPRHAALYVWPVPWPSAWTGHFNLITCVSVLDHVGLDAYGQQEDALALPLLWAEIARCLAPGGRVLLTVPVGRDLWTTHPGGGQRVFSQESLYLLLTGWHLDVTLYRLSGDTYGPVGSWANVRDAEYAAWRAEAVACVEVTK